MRLTVDRVENQTVICFDENGKQVKLSKKDVPENIREGSSVVYSDGMIFPDNIKEKELKTRNFNLLNKLLKKE
ncbi:MAG: DUF3006 domain-containing protein [Clostridia bacterium]|nr:DUF3006 domain-containing protein [Clostridia bacterium]MBR0120156.1 DUF3006 domain-containing protein [Clostridia bacterium]